MQNNQKQKTSAFKLKLLSNLTLAPEARVNEAVPATQGRFKRFGGLLKKNYSFFALTNLLSLLFLLPLLVGVAIILFSGIEDFAYKLNGMDKPYLLGGFGIGLSGGVSVQDIQVKMLWVYQIIFFIICGGLPIFGIGLAGALHVSKKFIWQENFITKKDKFGNNIPRITIEFFEGIKKYWKQTVLYTAVYSLFILGFSNLVILFIKNIWLNSANAGHYIGLIFGSIAFLIVTGIFINLLPLTVTYDTRIRDKFKNASILALSFPVGTFMIAVLIATPFLITLAGTFGVVISAVFLVMVGISFYALAFVNYSDYLSENILVELYRQTQTPQHKQRKKQTQGQGNNHKKKKR
ncbi:MAG: hypothetical protein FWD49_06585 [Firmicutes bacterium]|nr:hypothetical protein [Bacillota bacterium]